MRFVVCGNRTQFDHYLWVRFHSIKPADMAYLSDLEQLDGIPNPVVIATGSYRELKWWDALERAIIRADGLLRFDPY